MAGNPHYPSTNSYSHLPSSRTYEAYPERANLYQFVFDRPPTALYVLEEERLGKVRERVLFAPAPGAMTVVPGNADIRRALRYSLLTHLRSSGYKVKDHVFQVINTTVNYAPEWKFLRIHPAFNLRIMDFDGTYWLCVDHQLIVRSRITLATLEKQHSTLYMNPSQRVLFRNEGRLATGRLIDLDDEHCNIALSDGKTVISAKQDVALELTRTQIAALAPSFGIKAQDIEMVVKYNSFLTIPHAPRARLDVCTEFVQQLTQNLFPIVESDMTIQLDPVPASLRPPHFAVEKNFEEPTVAFDHIDQSKRAQDIFSGLTRFGIYDKATSPLQLLLVSIVPRRVMMENLVKRLNRGAIRYPGAQKTFGSGLTIREHLVCKSVDEYEEPTGCATRFSPSVNW